MTATVQTAMKFQRHLFAVAASLALATGSTVFAQTSTSPTDGSGMTPGSPSTLPTHPTERTTPSDRLPTPSANGSSSNDNNAATGSGSSAEAMQACKNMSSPQDRKDCMDKAARDTSSAPQDSDNGAATQGNPSGTSSGTYGGSRQR